MEIFIPGAINSRVWEVLVNYLPELYSVRSRRRICSLLLMNIDVT